MILEWLPSAQRDFDSIVEFIAADNPVAAIEQGDEIEEQVTGLLQNQNLGRSGRIKGTRELVIVRTPYIVVYRVKGERSSCYESCMGPNSGRQDCEPIIRLAAKSSLLSAPQFT